MFHMPSWNLGQGWLIREKLDVQMLLTGSIRPSAGTLRVVAQMIDTSSGIYLWSEMYERRIEHAADIQQEISNDIVATLRTRFGHGGLGSLNSSSYNAEAYELYLRGRGLWNQRTEPGIRAALDKFRQAVTLDPNFAAAYAGMADAYALLAHHGFEQPSGLIEQAKNAARRALGMDPSLGEAHCSLATLITMCDWNWIDAEFHFRRALALNPGYATTHHWFAVDFLSIFGRFDEAQREIEIAAALDPLSPGISEGRAFLFMLCGQYDQAEELLQNLIATNPRYGKAYAALGRTLIQSGQYEKAIQMLARAAAMLNDVPTVLGAMGQAYGLNRDLSRALELLDRLKAIRKVSYAPATALAITCLGIGDIHQALDWLEEGVERREPNVNLLGVHPAYDRLRGHPRLETLIRQRLGFPVHGAAIQR
jgi:tetratricopeptide (TPR) repeat protein